MKAWTHIQKDTSNLLSCAPHFHPTISAALLSSHSPFSVGIFSAALSLLASHAVKCIHLGKREKSHPHLTMLSPLMGLSLTLADPLAYKVTYCGGTRSVACLSICLTRQGVCCMFCMVRVSHRMESNQNANLMVLPASGLSELSVDLTLGNLMWEI